MFKVTTQYVTLSETEGRVVAKCNGKQRTSAYNPDLSAEVNHAAAAGTLLNHLTDERQQAMLRHPSGKQRVTIAERTDKRFKWEFNV